MVSKDKIIHSMILSVFTFWTVGVSAKDDRRSFGDFVAKAPLESFNSRNLPKSVTKL